jgi:hypothetical protein
VLVLCHPPKSASEENLQPRGGGAYIAEVDGNLTVNKDDMTVTFHWHSKLRGPDFAPVSFLLRAVTHERLKDSKGRLLWTVVAGRLSEAAQEEMAKVARADEDLLLQVVNKNPGASVADLARHLHWMTTKGEPHKSKVQRAIKRLLGAKLLSRERGRLSVTEKGKSLGGEMIGGITAVSRRGTVVPHPFRTTVPWIDLSGTVERFCRQSLHECMFQAASDGTAEPFERGALAPLSGRSVPGPSLRGTSGTASFSSLALLKPARPRRSPSNPRSRGVPARKVGVMRKRREDLRVIVGGVERSVEVKCCAADVRPLYDWFKQRDVLMGVLRLSLATKIANRTAA